MTLNPSMLLVIKAESDRPLISHLAVQESGRDAEGKMENYLKSEVSNTLCKGKEP